ncbi:MAG: MGMT family protein [Cyanobacteria bacterium J06642_2]
MTVPDLDKIAPDRSAPAASGETSLYERIYQVVRQIPVGRVATYGQVATVAGLPGHARQVGYALYRVVPEAGVPWQRVVNAKGGISRSPLRYGSDDLQYELLKAEGIEFRANDTIDLQIYGWIP